MLIKKYKHLEGKRVRLKEGQNCTGKIVSVDHYPHVNPPGPRLYIQWDFGCSPDGGGHHVLYSDIEGAIKLLDIEEESE